MHETDGKTRQQLTLWTQIYYIHLSTDNVLYLRLKWICIVLHSICVRNVTWVIQIFTFETSIYECVICINTLSIRGAWVFYVQTSSNPPPSCIPPDTAWFDQTCSYRVRASGFPIKRSGFDIRLRHIMYRSMRLCSMVS